MKRFIFTLATLFLFSSSALADGVKTQNVRLVRNGDFMVVDMDMDLTELKVKSNRAVIVTPSLVNGENSLNFSSVGVYGRKRYFYYVRDGKSTITGSSERSFRRAKRPDTIEYSSLIPYQKWMEGSNLVINNSIYGCCNTKMGEQSSQLLSDFRTPSVEKIYYSPTFVYMTPRAESKKIREIKGIKKAFIGSGIRYDLFDDSPYFETVVKHHTSGRLKVAPEHTEDRVLSLMRKPSFSLFEDMNRRFQQICRREELKYQLIPYFISSHPGCTERDMQSLADKVLGRLNFTLEQVQDLTPTPMTLSSVMFYMGKNPYTGESLYVARSQDDKRKQKSYFFGGELPSASPRATQGRRASQPQRSGGERSGNSRSAKRPTRGRR